MPPNGRHLDIGCGPGTFIGTLNQSHNLQSLGIDFSNQQIDFAKNTYSSSKANFQCIDFFDPFFSKESKNKFDIITFVEVIEHIERAQALKMLERAKSSLTTDGKLIVTTPNYHSGWGALEKVVNMVGEVTYEDQHINKYHFSSLEKDLIGAGFRSVKVSSFLSVSPFVAALSWNTSERMARRELYSGILRPCGFLLIGEAWA